jgi:hypothetical protein
VVAIEAEPIISSVFLDFSGSRGTTASHECNRFHVVDATWPLVPDTLAMAKGGAA